MERDFILSGEGSLSYILVQTKTPDSSTGNDVALAFTYVKASRQIDSAVITATEAFNGNPTFNGLRVKYSSDRKWNVYADVQGYVITESGKNVITPGNLIADAWIYSIANAVIFFF